MTTADDEWAEQAIDNLPDHLRSDTPPPAPAFGTPGWDDYARLSNDLGRVELPHRDLPRLLFSERAVVARFVLAGDWLVRHDADVARAARAGAFAEAARRGAADPGVVDGIRPHRYPRSQAEADTMRRLAEQTAPLTAEEARRQLGIDPQQDEGEPT